ncbi:hypothetical protein R80B4_02888 [Fibrobacteres bacterium R8-0-B4]
MSRAVEHNIQTQNHSVPYTGHLYSTPIVKSINAMIRLEILTGCEEFVDTMNAVIHRYKMMIHKQQGHHHGGGSGGGTGGSGGDVIHPIDGDLEEEGVLD